MPLILICQFRVINDIAKTEYSTNGLPVLHLKSETTKNVSLLKEKNAFSELTRWNPDIIEAVNAHLVPNMNQEHE